MLRVIGPPMDVAPTPSQPPAAGLLDGRPAPAGPGRRTCGVNRTPGCHTVSAPAPAWDPAPPCSVQAPGAGSPHAEPCAFSGPVCPPWSCRWPCSGRDWPRARDWSPRRRAGLPAPQVTGSYPARGRRLPGGPPAWRPAPRLPKPLDPEHTARPAQQLAELLGAGGSAIRPRWWWSVGRSRHRGARWPHRLADRRWCHVWVSMLDGGFARWQLDGHAVETGLPRVPRGPPSAPGRASRPAWAPTSWPGCAPSPEWWCSMSVPMPSTPVRPPTAAPRRGASSGPATWNGPAPHRPGHRRHLGGGAGAVAGLGERRHPGGGLCHAGWPGGGGGGAAHAGDQEGARHMTPPGDWSRRRDLPVEEEGTVATARPTVRRRSGCSRCSFLLSGAASL